MRWKWRGRLFACVVAVSGCAAPQHFREQDDSRQWADLCRRLRSPSASSHAISTQDRAATAGETARLLRVAQQSRASIVQIRTAVAPHALDELGDSSAHGVSSQSGGTGALIGSGGIILTSAHVVRNASAVTVVFPDGSNQRARSVALDDRHDIAVIRIGAVHSAAPLIPAGNVPRLGTPVIALSFPQLSNRAPFRMGVVTDLQASLQGELDPSGARCYSGLIESTAQMESGFSGGPLLDDEGRFVGLNVAVAGPVGTKRYRGYAIPLDARIREVIERLIVTATAGADDKAIPPE